MVDRITALGAVLLENDKAVMALTGRNRSKVFHVDNPCLKAGIRPWVKPITKLHETQER